MPYKKHEDLKKYQKKWVADRRKQHFDGKKCARCGKPVTAKTAELDHKKAQMQKDDHKIWSLSDKERSKEYKKTQILCKSCHSKKTKSQLHNGIHKDGERQEETLVATITNAMYIDQLIEEFLREHK